MSFSISPEFELSFSYRGFLTEVSGSVTCADSHADYQQFDRGKDGAALEETNMASGTKILLFDRERSGNPDFYL
uniref:hypothetical protein n=1 Tax=Pararhizobium sp. IMCC3301 TaxID=3067904 RepID=UPI002741400A|nr:hypothetical protein [Pararhizobium sp. IMCC3301]